MSFSNRPLVHFPPPGVGEKAGLEVFLCDPKFPWGCWGSKERVKSGGLASSCVVLRSGKDGEKGERGVPGRAGKDGMDGRDGMDGKDGKDGRDGSSGKDDEKGDRGPVGDHHALNKNATSAPTPSSADVLDSPAEQERVSASQSSSTQSTPIIAITPRVASAFVSSEDKNCAKAAINSATVEKHVKDAVSLLVTRQAAEAALKTAVAEVVARFSADVPALLNATILGLVLQQTGLHDEHRSHTIGIPDRDPASVFLDLTAKLVTANPIFQQIKIDLEKVYSEALALLKTDVTKNATSLGLSVTNLFVALQSMLWITTI